MTAKVGACWHCGALTAFRCARCLKFVCVIYGSPTPSVGCSRLVKARGQVGVYRLVCWPKCVKRRNPETLRRLTRKLGSETITYYETTKPDGSTVFVTVPDSENDE